MEVGKDFNITPYGTETMHLLRAEKGFIIVGQDTDATMTPIDLQMDWIVSKKKYDFIGKRSLYRSDTIKDDRKQLVGLLTDNPNEILEEGAQIVADVNKSPIEMLGHVTSSYYSPNLKKSIALGVVRGGKNMMGKRRIFSICCCRLERRPFSISSMRSQISRRARKRFISRERWAWHFISIPLGWC